MDWSNLSSEVATDLIKLIADCKAFEKNGKVDITLKGDKGNKKYSWVLLDEILERVKSDENFALLQPLGLDVLNRQSIKNTLVHKSGAVIESDYFPIGIKEEDNEQQQGIRITYKRRYSLGAFLGISTELDNDGNVDAKTDEEAISDYIAKDVEKNQKEITKLFNTLLTKHGTKENVYKSLGITREQFMIDYQSQSKTLLEQIKNHVK